MIVYVASRVLQSIVVILLTFTLSFFLLNLVPGDAALSRVGGDVGVSAAQVEEIRASMGLDRPWYEMYADQLTSMLTLDFGESLSNNRPVIDIIGDALPRTAQVAVLSMVVAIALATSIALLAVHTRRRWLRGALMALPAIGMSVPTFWLGVSLLAVFSFRLGWFPAFGSSGIDTLVLPVATLGFSCSAAIAQVLTSALLDASRSPYAFTAMAKGASRWRLLIRHCLRAASIPVLTMVGLLTGVLLTGAVVIEIVFSRAGIGREILQAVQVSDYPVVQGSVMLCAVIFVTVNLIVDLLYPLVDPRMRASMGTS